MRERSRAPHATNHALQSCTPSATSYIGESRHRERRENTQDNDDRDKLDQRESVAVWRMVHSVHFRKELAVSLRSTAHFCKNVAVSVPNPLAFS
jgi:hypothetical protein